MKGINERMSELFCVLQSFASTTFLFPEQTQEVGRIKMITLTLQT